jgi:hypothetical protein
MQGRGAGEPPVFVFISHAGFDEPVGSTIDSLVAALEASGFEPLIDRERVAHGTDFFAVVDRMIAICHAAIVIVSESAQEEDRTWVLTEAARLHDRQVSDRRFQIVPVFAGVDPKRLPRKWEPTGISRLAGVGVTVESTAAAARKVVEDLAPTRRRTQAAAAERLLANVLARLPESVVLRAAELVTGDRRLAGEPTLEVAARLLSADAETLWEVVSEVRVTDLQCAREILGFALPFTWVDRTCAASIPRAVAHRRAVGLNSEAVATSEAYVHCASRRWPRWKVVPVDPATAGEGFEQAERDALDALAHHAGRLDTDREDDKDEADGRMFVLAVSCPGFDPRLAGHMQRFVEERRSVGLILLGGDIDAATARKAVSAGIEYLRPELVRAHELEHLEWMRTKPDELVADHQEYLEQIGAA